MLLILVIIIPKPRPFYSFSSGYNLNSKMQLMYKLLSLNILPFNTQ
jgi:hypothetical protein